MVAVDLKNDALMLEHLDSRERKKASISGLASMISAGDIKILGVAQTAQATLELLVKSHASRDLVRRLPMEGSSSAQAFEVMLRCKWIEALRGEGYDSHSGPIAALDVRRLAKRLNLPLRSPRTLRRWLTTSETAPEHLLPKFDARGGRGSTRCDPRAEDILGKVIEESRTGPAKSCTPLAIYSEVQYRITAAGPGHALLPIKCPSLSTVTRRFNACISPYERDVARFGKRRADRIHRPTERRPIPGLAGTVSEFDDFDTKIFCIDERSGLPYGRNWLTAGVDQSSGYPVGLAMDNKPRSGSSAISALVHSIEPKNLGDFGIDDPTLSWHAHGYPASAIFDNISYNQERILSLGIDGADLSWARVRTPTDKREIEYFNGRCAKFLSTLPGYRGPRGDREAIAEGMSTAIFTMQQLRRLLLRWMLGIYANAPMSDGYTRQQKYLEANTLALRSRIPPDVTRLRLLRSLAFDHKLVWSPQGVRAMGLTYQDCGAYSRWVRTPGARMQVQARIDPENISCLYVELPGNDHYLVLPCLEQDYARGLTLYQHRLIVKACRQRGLKNPSLAELYRHRHDLREETLRLCRSGRISLRKRAARAGDIPVTNAQTVAEHDVEKMTRELDDVQADTGDEEWTLPTMI